jgi:hypothetical protein
MEIFRYRNQIIKIDSYGKTINENSLTWFWWPEHALAMKISQSNECERLYIAPGNAGTLTCGENVALDIKDFIQVNNFITIIKSICLLLDRKIL